MPDAPIQNDKVKPREIASDGAANLLKAPRSAFFQYYIHDGVDCFRLQFLGEFTESDVPELTGCWNTAKSTLARRKLLLDVSGLRGADDLAKRWLIELANEGAMFLPENYLRDGLAGDGCKAPTPPRPGVLSRLLSLFRGSPAEA